MKDHVIQVRINKELREKLEELAKADHRNISDFIRVQLIKLVEEKELQNIIK